MKHTNNFQMDDLYPDMFDDFNAEFEADSDEILDQIAVEPLDISELEDWDDEMGLEDDF